MIMYLVPKIFLCGFFHPCKIDKIFCPSNSAQPCFMEITTTMQLMQLGNNISSKLLKNVSKSIFLGNFKVPLAIFQNNFEFWFLVNLHHSLEHYEA